MKLLDTLVAEMKNDIEIKDRRYNFKTYKKCFLGNEAVDWLLQSTAANTRVEALFVGQLMVSRCARRGHADGGDSSALRALRSAARLS